MVFVCLEVWLLVDLDYLIEFSWVYFVLVPEEARVQLGLKFAKFFQCYRLFEWSLGSKLLFWMAMCCCLKCLYIALLVFALDLCFGF